MFSGAQPPQPHGPSKDKVTGEMICRSMIGNNSMAQEALKIKEKRKKEEKDKIARKSTISRGRQTKSAVYNQVRKSSSIRMSTSSASGFGKLNNFGMRSKQRKFNLKSKDLSDQQYQDLCYEVTRRIRQNQIQEEIEYSNLFRMTLNEEGG